MRGELPFFSICVPTRNRPETLVHCLKTLLEQDFNSYEVIISDNCDPEYSTETEKIVRDFNSDKLKYFRQLTVLSMTENYEFALSKASGKYITCLGDDDGLVINSLQYVHNFILKHNADVVKCCEVCYWWIGSHAAPDSSLSYPLERPVTKVLSKSVLEKVAMFEIGYFNLPMLYYSFVSRDIIESVISEHGNFFQNSASIDMYSGFTIAYKTESFYVSDKPFSICGQSSKSNGATVISDYSEKISKEYVEQHNLKNIYRQYQIPFLPKFSMPNFVALELSKFAANNNLTENDLNINFRNIFIDTISKTNIVHGLSTLESLTPFQEFTKFENDLKFIEDNFFDKTLFYPKLGNHDTNINQYINFNPRLLNVNNVYDAAVLCKKFIDLKQTNLPIVLNDEALPVFEKSTGIKVTIPHRIKKALKILLNRP